MRDFVSGLHPRIGAVVHRLALFKGRSKVLVSTVLVSILSLIWLRKRYIAWNDNSKRRRKERVVKEDRDGEDSAFTGSDSDSSKIARRNNTSREDSQPVAGARNKAPLVPRSWIYQSLYIAVRRMEGLAAAFGAHSLAEPDLEEGSEPLYLFSKRYSGGGKGREEFLRDFKAIIWLTYRCNFYPIEPPYYTSDTGWGCMLRSGQMILAKALQTHLGSSWEYDETFLSREHSALLRWFTDAPKFYSFYSVHRMSQCGRRYGKRAGQWYGPTTVALVLRDLVEAHRSSKQELGDLDTMVSKKNQKLAMLVTDDGTIYVDDLRKICEQSEHTKDHEHDIGSDDDDAKQSMHDPLLRPADDPKWSMAIFILVPLRLGLDHINPDYVPALLSMLKFPQSVGMIGGKPSHSLYFVGSQGKRLIHLDPHTVQEAASEEKLSDSNFIYNDRGFVQTYHCGSPKMMPVSELDPSLAVGFYCKNIQEFTDLRARIGQLSSLGPSIVSVMDSRPQYQSMEYDDSEDGEDEYHEALEAYSEEDSNSRGKGNGTKEAISPRSKQSLGSNNEDDFVLL